MQCDVVLTVVFLCRIRRRHTAHLSVLLIALGTKATRTRDCNASSIHLYCRMVGF